MSEQLLERSTLEGRGMDDGAAPWDYRRPQERVNDWISPNSGDIVLLANGRHGFQFGCPYRGQHGSLMSVDGLVPAAFGFPGASGPQDTALQGVRSFLSQAEPITVPGVEARALSVFFGVPLP